MNVPCFNCNTTTNLDVNFDVKTFACPNCVTVYKQTRDEGLKYANKFKPYSFDGKLKLGSIGTFDNKQYTITGLIVKSNEGYEWVEYVLQGKADDYLYLSESAGHWTLLEQIDFDKKVGNHPKTIDYENQVFHRFDWCFPKIEAAQGFFDFDIFDSAELIEYIKPPLVLSFDRLGREQTAFLGKYIEARKVKKAFGVSSIPVRRGIGMAQPFYLNVGNLAITLCVVALLILLSNWYLNKDRVANEVLNTGLDYQTYANKEFISPSFVLRGSAAPLTISLYSGVDNSWASVQVALVNEKTSEEVYASKDIEYYHGYSEGESWSEGSNSESFNLCGVPEGKYHLAITPSKAPEDVNTKSVQIKAVWSSPSMRNVWMIVIFMAVVIMGMFYADQYFENKRWEDSRN
ncbi:DUF4178 domain-containing protein [Flavobacterium muglaense]|uniref:DUF4178 domain-containing protein n=1 Tax=Flavobacterium muglaense TaxID=2764716 RepID=A0A923N0D1_9FLAO|nr:DUF4178 domain-containing protein [Flavobacterium muglaense]MBC5838341.1 DUF4178 domain-containing protein [Flavobacterium muglaense]MBC5844882.1 DUF4178 domain-containing protein [Flavobacterium muglaense]